MPLRLLHIDTLLMGLLVGCLFLAPAALAQRTGQQQLEELEGVGVRDHLGNYVPVDLLFTNEAGQQVELASFLDGERPVLLNFVYHDCPMLCSIILDEMTKTLKEMEWVPGEEFEVLTVSFNAIETPTLASQQKEIYLKKLGKPEAAAGWHFLTGDSTAIATLTEAVGYDFRWVESQQEFAHPSALIFLGGDGKITRYLHGVQFASRDVRTALVEASEGKVGNVLDQFIVYCFRYDAEANAYVPYAVNLMKLGGLLTLLALGAMLFVLWRREARKQQSVQHPLVYRPLEHKT